MVQENGKANVCQTITVREAKRANILYRPHGLRAMGEIAQTRKDLNFMPDALSIIPSVVEEMCEEDQMEVESKHGSAQDDTLAACVQCLLQCFNVDSGTGQSNQNPENPRKKKKSEEEAEIDTPVYS